MKLNLKILNTTDVTQEYVEWYSNSDVTRYSDNQYRNFTLNGQLNYVAKCLNNPDIDLYGIFDDKLHIGNILISGLISNHRCGELTYVVGNTNYWGKGVGYYAVSHLVYLSKHKYKLNKLFAGLAEENIGSRRVLEKNGFVLEGKRLSHVFYDGKFYNQLDFGLLLNN